METLKDGLLRRISALRPSLPIGLAERLQGIETPENIRIAVLDTGLDLTDSRIKAAKSRIVDKRSWIGPSDNCVDTDGHGTHVTRLLLEMAPSAQIIVAKIADGRVVDSKNMVHIAQVSLPCRGGPPSS